MPKKSAKALAEAVTDRAWLCWETLRRHPLYRPELLALLLKLRRRARARFAGVMSIPKKRAARDVLEAYVLLLKAVRARRAAHVHDAAIARRIRRDAVRFLPELGEFVEKWQLRFPVPTRFPCAPDTFLASPAAKPFRWVKHSDSRLVVDLWLPAGRDLAMAVMRGALDHCQDHRTSGLLVSRKRRRSARSETRAVQRSDWLRVSVARPAWANLEDVEAAVKPHLQRSQLALGPPWYYETVLRTVDALNRGGKATRLEVAERLNLQDPRNRGEDRGLDSLHNHQRIYRRLVRQFGLPALRQRTRLPRAAAASRRK